MKQKLILMLAVICQCLIVSAKDGDVVLRPKDSHGTAHYDEIPIVRYDDDQVTVSADTLMTDVRITITDRQGQVMASRQAALAPGMPVTLSVTDTPDCGKQTIEIIVDKQKYVGYFE